MAGANLVLAAKAQATRKGKRSSKFTKKLQLEVRQARPKGQGRPKGLNKIKTTPYPRAQLLRLRYYRVGTISSSATQDTFGGKVTFNLNDLLVPFVGQAVGNPLPYGIDQLSEMYRKYRVYGVRYNVKFIAPSASGCECGMYLKSSSETHTINTSSVATALQHRNLRTSIMSNTGEQVIEYKGYIDIHKLEGIPKDKMSSDDGYEGSMTSAVSGPTQVPSMELAIANRAAASTITCQIQVKLEYITRVYEGIDLDPSVT